MPTEKPMRNLNSFFKEFCRPALVALSLLLLLSIWGSDVRGSGMPISLQALVEKADIIAVGSLSAVNERTGETWQVGKFESQRRIPVVAATLNVRYFLKGGASEKQLKIYYLENVAGIGVFRLVKETIYFLQSNGNETDLWKGKHTLLNGDIGEIPIDGGLVHPYGVIGEPDSQKLSEFMAKIERLISPRQPVQQ
jgi:hypothetical protein